MTSTLEKRAPASLTLAQRVARAERVRQCSARREGRQQAEQLLAERAAGERIWREQQEREAQHQTPPVVVVRLPWYQHATPDARRLAVLAKLAQEEPLPVSLPPSRLPSCYPVPQSYPIRPRPTSCCPH